jgi:hypothetical protein
MIVDTLIKPKNSKCHLLYSENLIAEMQNILGLY